jgi:hypothetical protein
MATIERGIMFTVGAQTAPDVEKPFRNIGKMVDDLQKRMEMHLSVTERQARALATTGATSLAGGVNVGGGTSATERSRRPQHGGGSRVVGFAGAAFPSYQAMSATERDRLGKQNTQGVDRYLKEQSRAEWQATKQREAADRDIGKFQKQSDKEQAVEDRRSRAEAEATRAAQMKSVDEIGKGVDRLKIKQGGAAMEAAQRVKEALEKQKAAYRDLWEFTDRARAKGVTPDGRAVKAKQAAVNRAESHTGVARKELDEANKARERGAQAAKQQAAANRESEISLARQREAYSKLGGSIVGATDAVTGLGRGMALLGLAGESDMQGLTNSLLKIQGTVDTLRGGVQSIHDIGGLVRTFRDVHGTGGMAGVGRAFLGMGPAARAAGGVASAVGTAAGAAGTAAGAAQTGGVIAGALRTAGPSIGLAIASPIGIAVGAAAAAALAGYGIYRGVQSYGAASEKYGKGEREYTGQSRAAYISNQTVGGMFAGDAANIVTRRNGFIMSPVAAATRALLNHGPLVERDHFGRARHDDFKYKTQEQLDAEHQGRVDKSAKEKEQRDQRDRGWAAGFEQDFSRAREVQEARSQSRNSRRRLASTGDPMKDQRLSLNDLQTEIGEHEQIQRRAAAERQRMRVGQEGGLARGGEFDVRSSHEIVQGEEKIRSLKQQQAELVRDMQKTAIDGLKKQAELQRDVYKEARAGAEQAKQSQMSFAQRIATMNPMQVERLKQLKQRQERGGQLSQHDEELVERYGDEEMQHDLKQSQEARGAARIKGTNLGNWERNAAEATAWEAANEGNEQVRVERDVDKAEKQAGVKPQGPITVDGKIQSDLKVELSGLANISHDIERALMDSLPDIQQAFNGQFNSLEERIVQRVQANIDEAMMRQNMQGRVMAGGGR